MANQLAIPFKKTTSIPIRQAVRDYIREHHPDTHPDAFDWDIDRWEQLRSEATKDVVHTSTAQSMLIYYAQLTFVLTKLPDDIGLDIAYQPAFQRSAPWTSFPSLAVERASILFNLAALYSQMAIAEDRTHPDGIKHASALYQSAAGSLAHLIASVVPSLPQPSLSGDGAGVHDKELTEPFLRALEHVMLAQGQECAWQRAVMDNYKNGLIARISAKVASFYRQSASAIRNAPPVVIRAFPKEWLAHIDTKALHFEAAAQYRKSIDDLEANRYGHEIARLSEASSISKKAYDIARRSLVAKPVLNDVKSLTEALQKSFSRAERDNDLIYHQDVPALSKLPPIQEVALVKSVLPDGLHDPRATLGNDSVIFSELVGWGARVAIELFEDRRANWIREELVNRSLELDNISTRALSELRLPASLEALDKPVGLPPSLLRKAEEVRLEDGPIRIEESFEAVELLAERNRLILNQAMDLLDQEASEDEGVRRIYAGKKPWARPPSYEANVELTRKEKRYRQLLDQAAESDERVRDKWNEWEETISRLSWNEDELEQWVPSSTASPTSTSLPRNAETQTHARALRGHLESLEDLRKARVELVERAQRLAAADDIRPRILREAAGIARWTEVEPAMFENTLAEEMLKYDRFRDAVEENEAKQEELLELVKARNEKFLLSRRDDQSVKERERALQSLDLAYHKYREIVRNLEEGLAFYNDLAKILTQFREACKEWVRSRRDEMRDLSSMLDSLSSGDEEDPRTPKTTNASLDAAEPKPQQPQPTGKRGVALELPPPDSDEWEVTPAPVARPPAQSKTSVVNVKRRGAAG